MRSILIFLCIWSAPVQSREASSGYDWREIQTGIYLHTRIDPFAGPVDGNSIVIVGEDTVTIVDTHINPAATRAMIERIRSITEKPVSTIINTHWHDDHVNGNATLLSAFPNAEIIAHPYTREKLLAEWEDFEKQRIEAFNTVTVDRILEAARDAEANGDSTRAMNLEIYAGYVAALKPEIPTMEFAYPSKLISDRKIISGVNRDIEIRYVGNGNTQGDLIVWLPNEKILITGDIVVTPIPYAFDSPFPDWIETLGVLEEFEASTIIPGHGAVMEDNSYVKRLKTLLTETLSRVKSAANDGATSETLADHINLDDFRREFAGDDPAAQHAWRSYYLTPGLQSAWEALGYSDTISD